MKSDNIRKAIPKSTLEENYWDGIISFGRSYIPRILGIIRHAWKQRYSFERMIWTIPWLYSQKLASMFVSVTLSKATLWLLLGIFVGISLTFIVGITILCGRRSEKGNFAELTFTGSTLGPKKRKKRLLSTQKLMSSTTSTCSDDMDSLLKKLNIREIHKTESCDWWNMIIGQIVLNYCRSIYFREYAMNFVEHILETTIGSLKEATRITSHRETSFSSSVVAMNVTELFFDEVAPLFSNAKVLAASPTIGHSDAVVQVDVHYQGCIRLGIECEIVFNWPKPAFAILPILLSISLMDLYTTCSIHVRDQCLNLSLLPETFRAILDVKSSLGYRTQLRDLSKIKCMILAQIQTLLRQHIMTPNFITIPLPILRDTTTLNQPNNRTPMSKKMRCETMIPEPTDTAIQRKLSFMS
jgi:hypothetical protein